MVWPITDIHIIQLNNLLSQQNTLLLVRRNPYDLNLIDVTIPDDIYIAQSSIRITDGFKNFISNYFDAHCIDISWNDFGNAFRGVEQ